MVSERTPRRSRPTDPVGPRSSHEHIVFRLTLLAGFPAVLVAMVLLWIGHYSGKVQWTVGRIVVGSWLITALVLRERVVRPLQTLSNMLAALREGDYSIRARGGREGDALGEAFFEVNALGESMRAQRLGAMEATALLRAVMAEIDVAIFAFDGKHKLRLVNRAGERLLGRAAEQALGRDADELGLAACLDGEPVRTFEAAFAGAAGRWGVRRGTFREGGLPHQLLVLSDLSRELREEERQAWRRIIRVIGHELNNSLAPIKSIAASLESLLATPARAEDWEDDARRGLAVIGSRAEALNRFMQAYAALARLPQPNLRSVDVGEWVRRVCALESRLAVEVRPGPTAVIRADGDQLDQALINLVRNATDASLETHGSVSVRWARENGWVEVTIEDEGPGLSNTANLFVPFFTTKPGGSGIGLVLCRQIAEAHGGVLALENRADSRGVVARLRLPTNGEP
jgi:nitrogen fixation/metabolism regulation signal transduction histidine kinase